MITFTADHLCLPFGRGRAARLCAKSRPVQSSRRPRFSFELFGGLILIRLVRGIWFWRRQCAEQALALGSALFGFVLIEARRTGSFEVTFTPERLTAVAGRVSELTSCAACCTPCHA